MSRGEPAEDEREAETLADRVSDALRFCHRYRAFVSERAEWVEVYACDSIDACFEPEIAELEKNAAAARRERSEGAPADAPR